MLFHMLNTYQFRAYPNTGHKEFIAQHFGCTRKVYNHFLGKHEQDYKDSQKPWNFYEYKRELPVLKEQFPFLKDVNSQSLQAAVQNLDKAYKSFFARRAKHPRFKSKHHRQSFCVPQNTKVDFERGLVFIPKLKTGIRCKFHRRFEGTIKQTTLTKTQNGEYYISITVEEPDTVQKMQHTLDEAKAVGIDVGLLSFLTLSDGTKVDNPRWFKQSEKKLARVQRKLSKRIKGSKNRNKQRLKVAKQHQKVSNQRKDFQHKLSRKIVDDSQVSMIFVEDLNVRGMLKNRKLAKHISSVAWGQFLRFLEYKAHRAGKFFGKIGRFEPSSKMCHVCGHINHDLDLSERTWQCPHCLSVLDRDINAAINIRDIGLHTAGIAGIHACGEETPTVEPSVLQQVTSLKQEARHFNGE
jgi:putative transposase